MSVPNNPFPENYSVSAVTYGTDHLGVPLWIACSTNMASSRDSITWTIIPNSPNLKLLTFGKDSIGNPLWVGCSPARIIYTSSDGSNWTQNPNSLFAAGELREIIFGYDSQLNGLWIALGFDSTVLYTTATSTDGLNWTPVTDSSKYPFVHETSTDTTNTGAVGYGNGQWVAIGSVYREIGNLQKVAIMKIEANL